MSFRIADLNPSLDPIVQRVNTSNPSVLDNHEINDARALSSEGIELDTAEQAAAEMLVAGVDNPNGLPGVLIMDPKDVDSDEVLEADPTGLSPKQKAAMIHVIIKDMLVGTGGWWRANREGKVVDIFKSATSAPEKQALADEFVYGMHNANVSLEDRLYSKVDESKDGVDYGQYVRDFIQDNHYGRQLTFDQTTARIFNYVSKGLNSSRHKEHINQLVSELNVEQRTTLVGRLLGEQVFATVCQRYPATKAAFAETIFQLDSGRTAAQVAMTTGAVSGQSAIIQALGAAQQRGGEFHTAFASTLKSANVFGAFPFFDKPTTIGEMAKLYYKDDYRREQWDTDRAAWMQLAQVLPESVGTSLMSAYQNAHDEDALESDLAGAVERYANAHRPNVVASQSMASALDERAAYRWTAREIDEVVEAHDYLWTQSERAAMMDIIHKVDRFTTLEAFGKALSAADREADTISGAMATSLGIETFDNTYGVRSDELAQVVVNHMYDLYSPLSQSQRNTLKWAKESGMFRSHAAIELADALIAGYTPHEAGIRVVETSDSSDGLEDDNNSTGSSDGLDDGLDQPDTPPSGAGGSSGDGLDGLDGDGLDGDGLDGDGLDGDGLDGDGL